MLHPALERERRTIAASLGASARRLRELLAAVVDDAGVAPVHDLRKQLRCLRSLLRMLQGGLPLDGAEALVAECRWLAGRASGVRDLDVLLGRLDDLLAGQTADEQALERLRALLVRRRSRERRSLLAALRTRRTRRFLAGLDALEGIDLHAAGWADEPMVAAVLRDAYRRVRRLGRRIGTGSPATNLHELRKRCKRLRYLLELWDTGWTAPGLAKLLVDVRKLLDALGDGQDCHVHDALLQRVRDGLGGRTAADAAIAALIDRLLAVLAQHAARARAEFHRCFARFDRHRRRRRFVKSLTPDPLLVPPMVGTGGYCHGWHSGKPIPLPVGKVVCIGRNYAAHARELGNAVPEVPLLFIKPPAAVVDMAPVFRIPAGRGPVHHELEIAVLIGSRLRQAGPDQARAAIAGIGLGLDLTLRAEQDALKSQGHPWEVAKGFDGSCPLSAFVPLSEGTDLAQLGLRLGVNGRLRQRGCSAQMLMPIIALLCHASHRFSLWPGDVVLTGTPAGVAALVPGDRVSARLDALLAVRATVA